MANIKYATGRSYDGEQVLDITIEEWGTDEWGIGIVTATFNDASRHIKGRVINAPVFNANSGINDSLGLAVLAAYDHGHYAAI